MSVNNLTTLTGLGVMGLTIPDGCKKLHRLTTLSVNDYTNRSRLTVNGLFNTKMLIPYDASLIDCVYACESNL